MQKADRTILPSSAIAALEAFRAAYIYGTVSSALVEEVIDQLGRSSVSAAAREDSRIAYLAGLHRPTREPIFLSGLAKAFRSDADILRRLPRSAWIFLFHRNGYLREAALNNLTEPPPTPFFLAALALRMNDWAQPVRVAAGYRFKALSDQIPADLIAASSSFLLDRWRHWGRWEDDKADLVADLFERPDVVTAFAERMLNGVQGPLARELRYFLRRPGLDIHLQVLATRARTPAVRAAATKTQIDAEASWPCGSREEWVDKVYGRTRTVTQFERRPLTTPVSPEEAIRTGLIDRSAVVRLVAADALTRRPNLFPDLQTLTELMAKDRSPAVRLRADYLQRHGAPA